ncbi:ABC transporter substrate-binding protein [Pseudomonas sp. G11-1]|uniref:ABC transporter substrate-binding protein n=1 Tax=Halopseudomonas bauzanensis TaxID=653930 RepID=A0A031M5L0_9GAMM|nr:MULTISPECIES: ABC transporter substrate-binding protein [Halopseudomonas]MCO5787281.1 ABC transporter substrate-binding protein [Pseudomonas sp. G11-1]MCO5790506.1 ABC transporter substrate-binding protein [Pseudomonas sp. G11-2]EZQ15897.1 toluene tolerance protein [Halopseudomonas bauzanensis]TKA92018.1 ABC transporter substrate-binding protein [Halopseudomonas bauzanensis]WGK62257.1 ABC transporter substrate-binding protein [Halopseudomonas sp. SMJS2]
MRNVMTWGLALLLSMPLLAQAAAATPHQVVEDTSVRVMEVLDSNRELYKQDSNAFLEGLNEVLDPVVDFKGIARSVMTVRYSRSASDEQMERFIDTFKRSMVEFYGNALLEFNSGKIAVLPPARGSQQSEQRASVDMEVQANDGNVYKVTYTMANIDGQWKVRNVIVEGINIGLLFRDQFAQAMQAQRNDLDAVIDNWGSVVAESREIVEDEAGE